MLHIDQIVDMHLSVAEVEIQFEPTDYFVEESNSSVTVCVVQTSFPLVSFARPVELIFNTVSGSATGEQEFCHCCLYAQPI